ncbi:MAG: hypothetical protein ACYTBJ_08505 [Planctomycetota bacterium]|jgi:hypothetical protein
MMKTEAARKEKATNRCDSSDNPVVRNGNTGPKGKILRLKQGYNPNSSSMGSIIFVLPAALLGITVGFGLVSGIIASAFIRHGDNDRAGKENASGDEPTMEELLGMEDK